MSYTCTCMNSVHTTAHTIHVCGYGPTTLVIAAYSSTTIHTCSWLLESGYTFATYRCYPAELPGTPIRSKDTAGSMSSMCVQGWENNVCCIISCITTHLRDSLDFPQLCCLFRPTRRNQVSTIYIKSCKSRHPQNQPDAAIQIVEPQPKTLCKPLCEHLHFFKCLFKTGCVIMYGCSMP